MRESQCRTEIVQLAIRFRTQYWGEHNDKTKKIKKMKCGTNMTEECARNR